MLRISNKRLKMIVVFIYILVAVVAAVLVFIILSGKKKEQEWNDFSEKAAAYQTLMKESDIPKEIGDYTLLYDQIDEALRTGDSSNIDEYRDKMAAYTPEIEKLVEVRSAIEKLAADYDEAIANCSISDSIKEKDESMKGAFAQALKELKEEDLSDLSKKVDGVLTDIKADNLKQIQLVKNEINNIDISNAASSDKIAKSNKEIDIDRLTEDGKYKEALNKLQELKIFVSEIERRSSEEETE